MVKYPAQPGYVKFQIFPYSFPSIPHSIAKVLGGTSESEMVELLGKFLRRRRGEDLGGLHPDETVWKSQYLRKARSGLGIVHSRPALYAKCMAGGVLGMLPPHIGSLHPGSSAGLGLDEVTEDAKKLGMLLCPLKYHRRELRLVVRSGAGQVRKRSRSGPPS